MKIYNENLKKQFLIDRNFLTMVSTRKFKLQKESQAAYLTDGSYSNIDCSPVSIEVTAHSRV